jgi:CMP-N-acetylneuraminic acid synthetase
MICIIPARGGSKRLPGKNILPLFGQPVISHVINICNQVTEFEAVVVSTDDYEISEIASAAGAIVSMRPDELCGDVSEADVLKNFLDNWGGNNICRVYPFAALLTPERLSKGYHRFFHNAPDAVMECVAFPHSPYRAIKKNQKYLFPKIVMVPSEDLPTLYHDAATFMYTTKEALDKPLGERKIDWLPRSALEVQDVDTAEDFEMLKMKFSRKNK